MKTKTAVRILVVLVAIGLLTGYVVYSQKQQNRRVAPGSKAMALIENLKKIDGAKDTWALEEFSNAIKSSISAQSSNQSKPALVQKKPELVAPGSKSWGIFTTPPDLQVIFDTPLSTNSTPQKQF
ncbi:MAG: hypothetical protein JWM68_2973 [Verrucomicrobiales bacterium]|nr:hypothetical protein [Verrucomicrobiales bacterium]